jgi:hypothetical protein
LKTYQDLVNVAQSLGSHDLIYKFLEVHRHKQQQQNMTSAAKGLANIMMLDDRMKLDLLKIAPKILLLTYDYSKEVSDVMKELWSCLVDVERE